MIQQVCCLVFTQRRIEHFCLSQNLHKDVYCNFIHNCQNLGAATMPPVGEWINQVGIWTTEHYSALKKWAAKSGKAMEETNTYYEGKRPIWKAHALNDALERQSDGDGEGGGSQGVAGERGMSRRAQRT